MLVIWGWFTGRTKTPASQLITESSQFIITEAGDNLITE